MKKIINQFYTLNEAITGPNKRIFVKWKPSIYSRAAKIPNYEVQYEPTYNKYQRPDYQERYPR